MPRPRHRKLIFGEWGLARLGGSAPAAVEQATKFDLIINLTTAKALGLTIPESFLLRADDVIE
jgi:putative ABC transport system substrate-binding protein